MTETARLSEIGKIHFLSLISIIPICYPFSHFLHLPSFLGGDGASLGTFRGFSCDSLADWRLPTLW